MLRILFCCLLALPLQAQSPTASTLFRDKLLARIAALDQSIDGVLGLAVIDLKTGEQFSYHGDTLFPQASAIKIPIMVELFRLREAGQLNFDEKVTLQPSELVIGSGVIQAQLKNGPVTLTVRDLIREMIASSDNTATNWCIRRAVMANINHTMSKYGFLATRLQRVMLDQSAADRNEENISTPNEMVRWVKLLHEGKAVSPQASREMLDFMKLVKDSMRKAIPADVEVASKPGALDGVHNETGIVYVKNRPFAIAVMGTYLTEPYSPVEPVTKMVYDYFVKLAKSNQYGNLGVR
jgi:beta-lactamase class A